jgi:hypothetical protein
VVAVSERRPAPADEDHLDDDRPARELDDERDRPELRQRYYGLLQELRVLLPGTQVLVAFLLTVPFNNRFAELDIVEKRLYGVALGTGAMAIVLFVAPTTMHRLGPRRARAARLMWSIRLTRIGLGFMAASLVTSLVVVTRLVFGDIAAVVVGAAATTILVLLWVVLPRYVIPRSQHRR